MNYLVAYGPLGSFGRFRPRSPLALRRGSRVLVHTSSGLVAGEVLRRLAEIPSPLLSHQEQGVLERELTADDAARLASRRDTASALLARIAAPGVTFLDAEVAFDGTHAELTYIGRPACDLREVVAPLSREFGLALTLTDVGETPDDHGCGSCGSGGCGSCGSGGGCGSGCGTMKPEEVSAEFAELRRRMESRRVPLL